MLLSKEKMAESEVIIISVLKNSTAANVGGLAVLLV